MYVPVGITAEPIDAEVTEGVVGGGVAAAVVVGGVGEDASGCCECTEGVEGRG